MEYERVSLREYPKALCNDGTSAAYWVQVNPGPINRKKIMIYLEVNIYIYTVIGYFLLKLIINGVEKCVCICILSRGKGSRSFIKIQTQAHEFIIDQRHVLSS